jgi:hypothetical protein
MGKITTVGPHKVQHGDILQGLDKLMGSDTADLFYSDPPWGEGNLNYWQTMNKKMTGAPKREQDLATFFAALFKVVRQYATGYVFLEYGIKWQDEFLDMATTNGQLEWLSTVTPKYRSGTGLYPYHLHLFRKIGSAQPKRTLDPALNNTVGYATVKAAASQVTTQGGILLDPCCGLGYSARLAIETGMVFRGNELNRARLQSAIDKLERAEEKRRARSAA